MGRKALLMLTMIAFIVNMSSLSIAATSDSPTVTAEANPVSATEIQIPANFQVVVKTTQDLTTRNHAVGRFGGFGRCQRCDR